MTVRLRWIADRHLHAESGRSDQSTRIIISYTYGF